VEGWVVSATGAPEIGFVSHDWRQRGPRQWGPIGFVCTTVYRPLTTAFWLCLYNEWHELHHCLFKSCFLAKIPENYVSRKDAKTAKVHCVTLPSSWRSLRLGERIGLGCGRRPRSDLDVSVVRSFHHNKTLLDAPLLTQKAKIPQKFSPPDQPSPEGER
jgi:hypothetical protein